MVSRIELEQKALSYAEREWESILSKVTSSIARGFMSSMKQQVIDILRRTYLEGAKQVEEKG